jgi:alkylation response protein AidB-like acyl-CoA dehydrogenase
MLDVTADAVSIARRVATVAAEHADESESLRRLAPAVARALETEGLNRLVAPSALGGDAADPVTMVEVIETIAAGDASAGWCAGIGMGSNYLASLLPSKDVAKEVFRDVNRGGAGPFAPAGGAVPGADGAYTVNGRWPFSSNCHQAAVVAAGLLVLGADGPELGPDGMPVPNLGFFAADQMQIVETWDTVGLRGTGSHDVVALGAELPRERIASLFGDRWPDEPLFRLRSFDVLGACLAAVPLGIGRHALDVVAARAVADAAGQPTMPRRRLVDDEVAQNEYARAEVCVRAARALLHETLAASIAHAERGDEPPRINSALLGLANAESWRAGKAAVDTAVTLLGSGAVRESSAVGRLRRDIDTAGAHVMFSHGVTTALAKEVAGIPSAAFPYLPPPR